MCDQEDIGDQLRVDFTRLQSSPLTQCPCPCGPSIILLVSTITCGQADSTVRVSRDSGLGMK
jgi:hypothetical protein